VIDLIIQCGSKFALHQWLDARGLGENTQDTDPASPTFGDYFYSHTHENSTFIYWRHPSGKLEATPTTYHNGYYGILRFRTITDMESTIAGWVRNSTAASVLESFSGYGGEGVTLLAPEDIKAHLLNIGVPGHEILGGMSWSDPRVWWLGPTMIGDQRIIDGVTYESTIDWNVWSPTQYPGGWIVVEEEQPVIPDWQSWTGHNEDLYQVGDEVMHNGQHWRAIVGNNHWEPGVFGWELVQT